MEYCVPNGWMLLALLWLVFSMGACVGILIAWWRGLWRTVP